MLLNGVVLVCSNFARVLVAPMTDILLVNLDGDAGVGVNQLAVVGLGVGVPQMGPSLKEPGWEFPSGVVRAPSGSPGQGGGSVGGAGVVDLHVFVRVGTGVAENTGVHLDVTRTFAVTSETQNLTSLSEALLACNFQHTACQPF